MVSESLNFWISFILFFVFFEKIFKIKCLKGLFWVRAPHNLAFESFPSASDLLRLGLSSHKVPTPANKWIILNMMNLKYILSLPSDWFNKNSEFYGPVTSTTWTGDSRSPTVGLNQNHFFNSTRNPKASFILNGQNIALSRYRKRYQVLWC